MIRLGTPGDLTAATSVYRRASLSNAGAEHLEVTANPHVLGFYRTVGFIDCGVAETEFGVGYRMVLAIS